VLHSTILKGTFLKTKKLKELSRKVKKTKMPMAIMFLNRKQLLVFRLVLALFYFPF